MIRRFFRHIREGFYGVGRHAAMSVSSASAVTITLLIISIFMIVTGNMQEVTHNIEGSVKISAFVAYDHEEQAQLDMIQATIKESGTCGQRGILKQGSGIRRANGNV